jgi:hypothetical protein
VLTCRDGDIGGRCGGNGDVGVGIRGRSGSRGGRLVATPAGHNFGTWDVVALERGVVNVQEDAGVIGAVEVGAEGTGRESVGATAGDLEVHALRVVLGAVGFVGGVQGDGLVAEDVFTWGNGRRDGRSPGVVVTDHIVRSPVARGGVALIEAGFINLSPLERGFVNVCAFAVAWGEVIEHGSMMGLWPFGPL